MELTSVSAPGRWRIVGMGFIPAHVWAQGQRALQLLPLDTSVDLQPGMRVRIAEDT